jgi:hypothetical protein
MGLEGVIYPYFEAQVFSYKCYGIKREVCIWQHLLTMILQLVLSFLLKEKQFAILQEMGEFLTVRIMTNAGTLTFAVFENVYPFRSKENSQHILYLNL